MLASKHAPFLSEQDEPKGMENEQPLQIASNSKEDVNLRRLIIMLGFYMLKYLEGTPFNNNTWYGITSKGI